MAETINDAERNALRSGRLLGGRTLAATTATSNIVIDSNATERPLPIDEEATNESKSLIDNAKKAQKKLIIITIVIVVVVGGIAIWLAGRKKAKK